MWVEDTFGVKVKYHWLRKYLITHFKTKLQCLRKSHYKKDEQAIEAFLKLPNTFNDLRISLDKGEYSGINLYFQDESRFGLMTNIGKCLTARGVKPMVKYQHAFSPHYALAW